MSLNGPKSVNDWLIFTAMMLLFGLCVSLTIARVVEISDKIAPSDVLNGVWASSVTATIGALVWYVHTK